MKSITKWQTRRQAKQITRTSDRYNIWPSSLPFFCWWNMRKHIWIFVLSWIEQFYVGRGDKVSSDIVDCCLFIKEAIK